MTTTHDAVPTSVHRHRVSQCGLLGAGVGYSLSPALHEAEARALGLPLVYRIVDTAELQAGTAEIPSLIRHAAMLGFAGLNVTYPHKRLVLDALDELDPEAASLRAVNTIVFDDGRSVGHNTDCAGFGAGLDAGLPDADLARVTQFGCGGAGAATARALLGRGTVRLDLVDPDPRRRHGLARHLGADFPDCEITTWAPDDSRRAVASSRGIVNASPVGSPNAPGSPVDRSDLRPGMWVADIVYSPIETTLLRDAADAGATTLDGGRMLVHQAALSFELFHGLRPDVPRMREHFLRLVAGRGSPAYGSGGR